MNRQTGEDYTTEIYLEFEQVEVNLFLLDRYLKVFFYVDKTVSLFLGKSAFPTEIFPE